MAIFCGVVKKLLPVPVCPLKDGQCYWKHRQTAQCCFTADDVTAESFCERVGLDNPPSPEELTALQEKLQEALKDRRDA